ncbi:hypothetical protein M077_0679 [Bacteroides fragilis str. 2-F-2 |nr:hypothetical protein M077_0679 [Bacteroides fragilis str. 2-F-2 \
MFFGYMDKIHHGRAERKSCANRSVYSRFFVKKIFLFLF